ncbi:MAG: hypothetical protein ACYS0G_06840 [Planctomycetota bacterium]
MALLAATWSPGHWWCCCQAHAADTGPGAALWAGVAGGTEAPTACCSEKGDLPAPAWPDAFAAGPDRCCGPDLGPPEPSPEGSPCGCVHGLPDAALPVAAIAPPPGPASQSADLLVALPPALATISNGARGARCCRGSPRRVPARSLLSLGCLLTT